GGRARRWPTGRPRASCRNRSAPPPACARPRRSLARHPVAPRWARRRRRRTIPWSRGRTWRSRTGALVQCAPAHRQPAATRTAMRGRTLLCVPSVLKLDLIGHGITEALRAARFPADEPLTEAGRNALPDYAPPAGATVLTGPEPRTVQTAEGL